MDLAELIVLTAERLSREEASIIEITHSYQDDYYCSQFLYIHKENDHHFLVQYNETKFMFNINSDFSNILNVLCISILTRFLLFTDEQGLGYSFSPDFDLITFTVHHKKNEVIKIIYNFTSLISISDVSRSSFDISHLFAYIISLTFRIHP